MSTEKKRPIEFVIPSDVDETHCPKRLCSMDPDVKVVVGGEVFYHYGVTLSFASEYFDTMLGSSMKEGETRVVEFPDKNAGEWRQLYQWFIDRTKVPAKDLTDREYLNLLPWFSELRMMEGLNRCHKIMKEKLLKQEANLENSTKKLKELIKQKDSEARSVAASCEFIFEDIVGDVESCSRYNLSTALEKGLSILKKVMTANMLFLNSTGTVKMLAFILKDEASRNHLLPTLMSKLPNMIPEMDPEDLVSSPLFKSTVLLAAQVDFYRRLPKR